QGHARFRILTIEGLLYGLDGGFDRLTKQVCQPRLSDQSERPPGRLDLPDRIGNGDELDIRRSCLTGVGADVSAAPPKQHVEEGCLRERVNCQRSNRFPYLPRLIVDVGGSEGLESVLRWKQSRLPSDLRVVVEPFAKGDS